MRSTAGPAANSMSEITHSQIARAVDDEMPAAEALFDDLAERTRDVKGVTRPAFSEVDQAAAELIADRAREQRLEVSYDHAGNLYMTLPGKDRRRPGLAIGSHLDSVPRGGNYDGAAGVVAGFNTLTAIQGLGIEPPHDLTAIGLRGEESVWFGVAYLGSRLAVGALPIEELDRLTRSDTGRTLSEHIGALGFDTDALRAETRPAVSPTKLAVFLELHIEQGPVLEGLGIPVGIPSVIRGNVRFPFARCLGAYTHSAAVPRAYRSDAVLAAAELVHRVDRLWQEMEAAGNPDLVFTVGKFFTDEKAHAMTKVPGEVSFTLNFGATTVESLERAHDAIVALADEIGQQRRVRFELGDRVGTDPTPLEPGLREQLRHAAEAMEIPYKEMATVGHDASVFARAGIPAAMVLVRNSHGSHNPEEAMRIDDYGHGVRVLTRTVLDLMEA